ncbi:MAG TPA: hypothetical protein PLV92_26260, partial [Pirellulaceae bacterium]|nr:hypothetical protein [Pirellulaceae bacterium]
VQFIDGSFQDVNGVLSAANTESFTAEGVAVALADPLAFSTTGVTIINSRGYIDLRFTPTPGATLNEATITDAAKEFQFTGDAALNVTPSGVPTAMGDGVYRYPFTGQFEVGKIGIEWIADAVADSAGIKNAAGSEEFVLDAPAAELFYPAIEMRADRSTLNDRGYIDIKFNDRTGRGLDATTITDVGQEFELLVKNDAGEWVAPHAAINGAALKVGDNTYRYFFSNFFEPGVVRVQFLAGSFLDVDGAQNLAEEQQFAVVSNAPSFEFQIEGDLAWRTGFKAGLFGDLTNTESLKDILKMIEPIYGEIGDENSEGFQKLRDLIGTVNTGLSILQPFLTEPMIKVHGFLRFGSELLVDGGGQTIGARTTVDMSGSLAVYLLGPVGAAAGRVVVQVDDHGLNLWGVMELQAKLDFLNK